MESAFAFLRLSCSKNQNLNLSCYLEPWVGDWSWSWYSGARSFVSWAPQGKLRALGHSQEVVQRENAGHAICICTTHFSLTSMLFTHGNLVSLDHFEGRNYVFYYSGSTTQSLLDQRIHNALICLQQWVK